VNAAGDAIRIRTGHAEDVPSVLAVDHETERADCVRRAVLDDRALVAEVRNEVVGFSIDGEFFGCAFLELLVVATAHRRARDRHGAGPGVGGAGQISEAVHLDEKSNLPMQRLCERLG
jgi:hypothetical protein